MKKRQRPTSMATDTSKKAPKRSIFYKLKQKIQHLSPEKRKRITRALIFAVLVLAFVATFIYRKLSEEQIVYFSDDDIQVVDENIKLGLEEYQGENFSMQIPKGWQVESTGKDETSAFYAYNPNDKRFSIFVQLQSKPLMRNYDERNIYKRYVNTDEEQYGIYADAPVIRLGTVETFYQSFARLYAKYPIVFN